MVIITELLLYMLKNIIETNILVLFFLIEKVTKFAEVYYLNTFLAIFKILGIK